MTDMVSAIKGRHPAPRDITRRPPSRPIYEIERENDALRQRVHELQRHARRLRTVNMLLMAVVISFVSAIAVLWLANRLAEARLQAMAADRAAVGVIAKDQSRIAPEEQQ